MSKKSIDNAHNANDQDEVAVKRRRVLKSVGLGAVVVAMPAKSVWATGGNGSLAQSNTGSNIKK